MRRLSTKGCELIFSFVESERKSLPSQLRRASALACWIMPVNKPIVLIFLFFSFEWFAFVDIVVLLLSPLHV